MKQILLVAALLVSLVLPREGRADAADSTPIEAVISEQLQAFVDRDVARAWRYASPMIRGLFRTPENFGRMVRDGYPMVWTPAETEFLGLREEGGALWQRVVVMDASGTYHLLDYKMISDGATWLIDGVMVIANAGVGA